MVRIGVIDAPMCSDELSGNLKIYNPQGIQNQSNHGNDVARYILFEYAKVEILNYVIIGEHDKGKVNELIEGIEFCISEHVDTINISVGIKNISHTNLIKLQECCEKAYRQGITLIAAGSNDGEISYPACLEHVVMVSEKKLLYKNKVKNKWNITYDSNMVISKVEGKNNFNIGNSFLCAITTGAYAAFLSAGILKKDKYGFGNSFLNIYDFMYNKNLLSTMQTKAEMTNDCIYIRLCEQDEIDTEIIEKMHPKIVYKLSDMKALGISCIILGNIYYPIDNKLKQEIAELFIEYRIEKVYTIKPIFNIYERYMLYIKYNILVENIYM